MHDRRFLLLFPSMLTIVNNINYNETIVYPRFRVSLSVSSGGSEVPLWRQE